MSKKISKTISNFKCESYHIQNKGQIHVFVGCNRGPPVVEKRHVVWQISRSPTSSLFVKLLEIVRAKCVCFGR